jgi:SDR family mycofactocin-dependent oxidoreductase
MKEDGMKRLEGRVALITGAGRGQGRAEAITLAREGADVVLVDAPGRIGTAEYPMASEEELQQTASDVEALDQRAIAVVGDVRSQAVLDEAVRRGIAELGKIDFFVGNAGIWGELRTIATMSDEAWQETIDINLTGMWRGVRAVAQHMMDRGDGAIVLCSSTSGVQGQALSANYAAAKHGVLGLMKSAAVELGPYNVRCNAILPGFIDTPIHHWQGAYDQFAGRPGGTAADRQSAARYYGILRDRGPLDPRHVANTVLFLLSDESSEITGCSIPVDAGHLVLPHFNPSPGGVAVFKQGT